MASSTPTIGATDIACPYGGDVSFDSAGRLQTVRDIPGDPAATKQRIEVILMQSPRPSDLEQNAIGRPDDLFNPDLGAGLRAIVGLRALSSLEAGVKSRTLKSLALDEAIAQAPAPTVSVTSSGPNYIVSVTAFTNDGSKINLTQALGG